MSDLDKTGKKLIDSIRMTKEGPATAAVKSVTEKKASSQSAKQQKSPVASTSESTAAKSKVKTASGVTAKSSKKPKSTAGNRNKQARKIKVTNTDVPYQDGSQVWPD